MQLGKLHNTENAMGYGRIEDSIQKESVEMMEG